MWCLPKPFMLFLDHSYVHANIDCVSGLESVKTVSYTHLDVYKRQMHDCTSHLLSIFPFTQTQDLTLSFFVNISLVYPQWHQFECLCTVRFPAIAYTASSTHTTTYGDKNRLTVSTSRPAPSHFFHFHHSYLGLLTFQL